MKRTKVILGAILALTLIFCFVSCGDDGGGGFGLPSSKSIKSLPKYEGATVTSASQARELWNAVNNNAAFFNGLKAAEKKAYDDAFDKKYKKSQSSYYEDIREQTKASVSVSIDDNETLKTELNKTIDSVKEARIKGSSSASFSSNLTLGYTNGLFFWALGGSPGDKISETYSEKRDFNITDGFYTFTTGSGTLFSPYVTYNVTGSISVENYSSYKITYKDKPRDDEDFGEESKISVGLTISDGTKGAKFRFSAASDNNTYRRKVEEDSQYITSDVEVYDNDNKLIFTLTSFDTSRWADLPKALTNYSEF